MNQHTTFKDARAEAALARFRAQWPAERCKRLGDAIIGTPAEKAAANASFVAQALEPRADDTLSDAALRELSKAHRSWLRQGGR